MNRLIRNELTKIFHKKSIYIMLIVILLFMITITVINKIFENSNIFSEEDNIEFYEDVLKNIDKNDPQNRDTVIGIETNIEIAKLIKKYGKDSWQAYVISNKGNQIITNMKYSEGTENSEKAKIEYDAFIKRLENDDWKSYAKEELEDTNNSISMTQESLKEKMQETQRIMAEMELSRLQNNKQALEWRLEKNISYSKSNLNNFIEQWLQNKEQLESINQTEQTKPLTYEDKCEKQQTIANIALLESAIKNTVNEKIQLNGVNNTYALITNLDFDIINIYSEYSVFIIIAICIIAGTIVSEEFNKGTIKLLLVRPYKRTKILVAKFITCLIIFVLVLIFVAVAQYVVSGIANGFGNYSKEITIYNFSSNNVQNISLLKYVVITAICKMPMFLLLLTLSFTLSVVFNNSPVAIALPLLGTMASEIINGIALHFEKAKFLRFFVTPNWDLSIYLFGKMPEFEPISFNFSVVICLIYFVVMLIMSIVTFKNRDIKNI